MGNEKITDKNKEVQDEEVLQNARPKKNGTEECGSSGRKAAYVNIVNKKSSDEKMSGDI